MGDTPLKGPIQDLLKVILKIFHVQMCVAVN